MLSRMLCSALLSRQTQTAVDKLFVELVVYCPPSGASTIIHMLYNNLFSLSHTREQGWKYQYQHQNTPAINRPTSCRRHLRLPHSAETTGSATYVRTSIYKKNTKNEDCRQTLQPRLGAQKAGWVGFLTCDAAWLPRGSSGRSFRNRCGVCTKATCPRVHTHVINRKTYLHV